MRYVPVRTLLSFTAPDRVASINNRRGASTLSLTSSDIAGCGQAAALPILAMLSSFLGGGVGWLVLGMTNLVDEKARIYEFCVGDTWRCCNFFKPQSQTQSCMWKCTDFTLYVSVRVWRARFK